MNSFTQNLARWWRRCAPPAAVETLRHWRHGPRFSGDFADWPAAAGAAVGYGAKEICDRVVTAARAVRAGTAAWDRDGTLFNEPVVQYPLLAALLSVAAREGGSLALLDFGGALGSTWWQHRHYLPAMQVRRWDVVEQPALVACGCTEFTQPPLRFFDSIGAACADGAPPAILFSGVLQYLPDPFSILREVAARGFRHVILDRTCFNLRGRNRLTVQTNGSLLRRTQSYPCWFFDRHILFDECLPGYQLVDLWPGFDSSNLRGTSYHGALLIRSNA